MPRRNRTTSTDQYSSDMLFDLTRPVIEDAAEIDIGEDVSDRALEEVIDAFKIEEKDNDHDVDLESVNTEEKLRINLMEDATLFKLEDGIVYFTQVQNLVNERAKVCPGFQNKFKNFFKLRYKQLVHAEGKVGDIVFDQLERMLTRDIPNINQTQRRAIRPILTYLFVICDLFYRTEEERDRDLAR